MAGLGAPWVLEASVYTAHVLSEVRCGNISVLPNDFRSVTKHCTVGACVRVWVLVCHIPADAAVCISEGQTPTRSVQSVLGKGPASSQQPRSAFPTLGELCVHCLLVTRICGQRSTVHVLW